MISVFRQSSVYDLSDESFSGVSGVFAWGSVQANCFTELIEGFIEALPVVVVDWILQAPSDHSGSLMSFRPRPSELFSINNT